MQLKSQIVLVFALLLMAGCKSKKKQLLDTEAGEVDLADFVDFFEEITLPFHLPDTILAKKSPDSLRIGNKIFAQFAPDSIFRPVFGPTFKPQIYPIGKISIKNGETYLLVKAAGETRRAGYAVVFDKGEYKAILPLLSTTAKPDKSEQAVANIDSRYTITKLRQRTTPEGQILYHKDVYIYNTEGMFTLILTESNDKAATTRKIQNPIDTLAATHKLTGDYTLDARNIVSFRDGHRKGTLQFFIHFEKDKGACVGELKGEAKITGTNSARYTESNGPCVIDFQFSGNNVRMKELEGCGSYRDIKCFFEGTYTRKKKPVSSDARKKSSSDARKKRN